MAPRIGIAVMLLVLAPSVVFAQVRPSPLDAHGVNPDSEYFVAEQAFEGGYLNVSLARMVRPGTRATGNEAEFMVLGGGRGGQLLRTRYYWRTRIARPEDLQLGRVAFCLDAQANNVYRAPQSRAEATAGSWFAGAIVDLSNLDDDQVILDAFRASRSCLRVADGGPSDLPRPTPPALDTHFVDSADFFVRMEDYEGGYGGQVSLARMVRGPTSASNGEAEFLALQQAGSHQRGQRFWTRHYWRTRAATPQDLRDGTAVVVLDAQDQGMYRAPHDRFEALTGSWWIGAITDLAGMFRGEVQVGDFRVRPDALRVIVR